MRIFLSAGEVSGDVHGAFLAYALKKAIPGVQLEGIGGERMRAAGIMTIQDLTAKNSVGFTEGLRFIPDYIRALRQVTRYLRDNRPDCIVFIDNQGFNLEIAKKIRKYGIYTFYYFAPQLWMWGLGSPKKIEKTIDHILATFRKEWEYYRDKTSITVDYIGHPLLEEINVTHDAVTFKKELGIDDGKRLIGLLPGSRTQELSTLLPVFLAVAEHYKDKYHFVIPFATKKIADQYKTQIPNYIHIMQGRSHEIMAAADLLIMSSGTATLEAALFNTPMIITYKVSKLTEWIARRIVKINHIGMPNILLDKEVCPELIQDAMTSENIILTIESIFNEYGRYEAIINDLAAVRALLEPNGAITRAAALIQARCTDGQA